MNLLEALEQFPDDATAEAWFVAKRWPNGASCPSCASTNVLTGAKHHSMPDYEPTKAELEEPIRVPKIPLPLHEAVRRLLGPVRIVRVPRPRGRK